MQEPITDPDAIAALKAEKRTDIQFDFDLEDIIAGNIPESETGRQLKAIVDNFEGVPTQSRVEAALLPLYESMVAEVFRQEGGSSEPPAANRHAVRQHAVKVMQARKVKRTAMLRAAGRLRRAPRPAVRLPVLPLAIIAGLLIAIAAAIYFQFQG